LLLIHMIKQCYSFSIIVKYWFEFIDELSHKQIRNLWI
jgi:hypothetical protein